MNAKIWGRWVSLLFQQQQVARRQQTLQRRLAFEPLEDRVTPTTFIWSGAGSNNNWSTGANWQGGVAPSSLANPDLVFQGGASKLSNNNDIANLAVKSITISASNYILNGSKILLGGNATVGAGATNEQIKLDVQLTTAASFTVNNVADLTVSGHLSGSSVLTKKGVGTMTLSSDNSAFTGAIDIQTGRLIIGNVNALGSTSDSTTVEANAQLQIKGVANPINETLILNGPGATNDGALLNFSGNSTWAGTITMDSDASFGVATGTSLNVSGLITDTGFTGGHNLTKVGPGNLIFSRSGGNTYRGQTVINNGILTIRDPQSLGAGATAGTPQSGSPQSGTIVNSNSTTGEAGTLRLEYKDGTIAGNDANAVLEDPTKPFNANTNKVVGFQVFNDLLTINGQALIHRLLWGELGQLNNLSGKNIWNGDVTLGSAARLPAMWKSVWTRTVNWPFPVWSKIRTCTPDLRKIMLGRLILDNTNTYHGNTACRRRYAQRCDSGALGPAAATDGSVNVRPGAALELEVDRGSMERRYRRTIATSASIPRGQRLEQEVVVTGTSGTLHSHSMANRPRLWRSMLLPLKCRPPLKDCPQSVQQCDGCQSEIYRISFGGTLTDQRATAVGDDNEYLTAFVNPMWPDHCEGRDVLRLSATFTGALHSISGVNLWTGDVNLGDIFNPSGSIAVDLDQRPGHPSADNSYFTRDYSLTIATVGALRSDDVTMWHKFGDGQLILPVANSQLLGELHIAEGWITVQDSLSLGPVVADPARAQTVQPNPIKIDSGAALHLRPLAGNINIANNIRAFGQGIHHPFAMLEEGAILSLGGNNVLSGDIQLGASSGFNGVGIGVDDPIASNPASASTLTTTGTISDFSGSVINLTLTASGLEAEQRFPVDTGATSGRIVIDDYAFYSIPDDLRIYYPPRSLGGTLIFDSGFVSDPLPPGTPPVITVNYGPGTSTFIEIVMNEGGGNPGTVWDIFHAAIFPNTPPGSNGIVKMGSRLLRMQGDGTYTGDVEVRSGTLRVQNDSALGRDGSGTAIDPTTQSFTNTKTTVNAGALLELDSTIPQTGGGFAAGVQVWDEQLVLNGAGQEVAVNGTAGTFTLSFNGQTTASLAPDVTATQMQAALNALPSIGGIGGTATVTQNGNIYTVTFGGTLAGQNNPLMTATPGQLLAT